MSDEKPDRSIFKTEITLGQVLAIAIPIVLLMVSNWVAIKVELASKESDYKILEAKVGAMEHNYS